MYSLLLGGREGESFMAMNVAVWPLIDILFASAWADRPSSH